MIYRLRLLQRCRRLHLAEMFQRRYHSHFVASHLRELHYYLLDYVLSCLVDPQMFYLLQMILMLRSVHLLILSRFYLKLLDCQLIEFVLLTLYYPHYHREKLYGLESLAMLLELAHHFELFLEFARDLSHLHSWMRHSHRFYYHVHLSH